MGEKSRFSPAYTGLNMRATLVFSFVLLSFLVAITISTHNCALAELENWTEVARFTGVGSQQVHNTTLFAVDHAEWRVRWQYTLDPSHASEAGFVVFIYRQGETTNEVGTIFNFGGSQTNGTADIHNVTGTFYFSIHAGVLGIVDYTLIVEQDLDSAPVPEFPSSTVIPLAFTVALLITIALAYQKHRSTRVGVKIKD